MGGGLARQQCLLAFAFGFASLHVGLHGVYTGFGRIDRGCCLGYARLRALDLRVLNLLGCLVACELCLRGGQPGLGFCQHRAIVVVLELDE